MAKELELNLSVSAVLASNFTSSFSRAGERVKYLSATLEANRKAAERNQAEYNKGAIALDVYNKRISELQKKVNDTVGATVHATINDTSRYFGKGIAKIQGVVQAAQAGLSKLQPAMDFEAGMSRIKALTGATGTDFDNLSKKAKQIGASTKYSATDATEGMAYLGMAGWNTGQILSGLDGVIQLSLASGEDLARTSDIVSDNLTAFGLAADQAGRMADVYAYTATKANTTVSLLGETMKYAAPIASSFGLTLEETAAAAGFMANAGIKGSEAGTALRSGLLRLVKPTSEVRNMLASLNVSLSDSSGKNKTLSAILSDLQAGMAGMTEQEKLAATATIFGTEASQAWIKLLGMGGNELAKFTHSLELSKGTAENTAKVMSNNMSGALTNFNSAVEGLSITVGSSFVPTTTDAVNAATFLVHRLNSIAEASPTAATGISALLSAFGSAAAIVEAAEALGSFAKGIMAIKHACKMLNLVGKTTLAGLIITSVLTLGAIAYDAYTSSNDSGVAHGDDVASGGAKTVASNESGGIYKQGAFLTTFAEGEGESAIPHSPTARNIGLLAKTNEIMGTPLGGNVTATYAPVININGTTNTADVQTALDDGFSRFKAFMTELQREERRVSYE